MRQPAPLLPSLLFLSCAIGCNADLHGGNRGNSPDGGASPGTPDLACPPGAHFDDQTDTPRCVPDGEITCATEFPCPNGETCVAGRCVGLPGPCMTNDDCPTGWQCLKGQCEPACPMKNPQCKTDTDCHANQVCVACLCVSADQCQTPTADLAGPLFNAKSDLHLDEALGQFGGAFAGLMKQLRDGILKCPPGSAKDCFLFQLIADVLPEYAKIIILAVGNLADVLDNHNFYVQSEMTFTHNGKPNGYSGVDHWTLLSFIYQNQFISEKPEMLPEIGKPVFIPFEASAVCGVLYIDKHKVVGVLNGLLHWMVDSVIEYETCGKGVGVCYHTLGAAIDGAIDCSKVWDPNAKKACVNFRSGLKQKIDDLFNLWLVNYAFMTLKGTAMVEPGGHILDKGHWDGTLGDGLMLFKNFTGEWNAQR